MSKKTDATPEKMYNRLIVVAELLASAGKQTNTQKTNLQEMSQKPKKPKM
jgi:hypothetical protein